MPITFGVSDIIAVSILIKNLVRCLDESRGSPAEYQAVIRELRSLDRALLEVDLLLRSCEQSAELNGLWENANRCAEQCRQCIKDFQEKIERYQRTLQQGGTGNMLRETAEKVRWRVSKKDDLAKFRSEITAHWSSMNLLLATAGIKLSMLNDEGMHKRLTSTSATQTSVLVDIGAQLEEAKSLLQALVSLQARIPAQLNRCWIQEPVELEDALGRVSRFHLDFIDSWEVFESALEERFRQFPGHRKIKQGKYALRSTVFNKDISRSTAFNRCFLPGQHYDMSIIFDAARVQNSCPACLQVTGEASEARVKCISCGLEYQRIVESVADAAPAMQGVTASLHQISRKGQQEDEIESDDEPRQFRRVRIRCRRRGRKRTSADEALFEAFGTGEETIRCVCGTHHDLGLHGENAEFGTSARILRTWLIQCGACNVWQHRSCVGTANETTPPGGFYCERCPRLPSQPGHAP